jgi:hypothetical protein
VKTALTPSPITPSAPDTGGGHIPFKPSLRHFEGTLVSPVKAASTTCRNLFRTSLFWPRLGKKRTIRANYGLKSSRLKKAVRKEH